METFLINYGYVAVLLFAFIEACCIPISSEITFGFAGVLAAEPRHHLSLVLVIVIGVLAELAGSTLAYGIGRWGGRPAVDRFGKYVLLTHKDVDRVERFFAGRGVWAVGVARVVPLLRAFIGLVAGLVEVPLAPFELFNLIGTAIWATALASIGYAVGHTFNSVTTYLSDIGYLAALFIVVPLALAVFLRLRERRRELAAGEPTLASDSAEPPARPASHRRTSQR